MEEIVLGHGYAGAIGLLLVVPIVWSLPVALMVGELGAALPATGGYYVWVQRALGAFWGLQEAWLSLAVGIVNVAIYPTLLVTYLGRLWPRWGRAEVRSGTVRVPGISPSAILIRRILSRVSRHAS